MDELCSACLSAGRNMYYIQGSDIQQVYIQILNEISVSEETVSQQLQVCWECRALLRRFQRFRWQAQECYTQLMVLGHQNTTYKQRSRLVTLPVHTTSFPEPESIKMLVDVKIEELDETPCEPGTFFDEILDNCPGLDETKPAKRKKDTMSVSSNGVRGGRGGKRGRGQKRGGNRGRGGRAGPEEPEVLSRAAETTPSESEGETPATTTAFSASEKTASSSSILSSVKYRTLVSARRASQRALKEGVGKTPARVNVKPSPYTSTAGARRAGRPASKKDGGDTRATPSPSTSTSGARRVGRPASKKDGGDTRATPSPSTSTSGVRRVGRPASKKYGGDTPATPSPSTSTSSARRVGRPASKKDGGDTRATPSPSTSVARRVGRPASKKNGGDTRATPSPSPSTSGAPPNLSRRSILTESKNFVNYGSEGESSDSSEAEEDDDVGLLPAFIPWRDRVLFLPDDDSPVEETPEPAPALGGGESAGEGGVYGPTDPFHFDWAPFTSPVAPAARREAFRAGEAGPTAVFSSPYDAFTAIWTPEFLQEIVTETNRYAEEIVELKIRDGSLCPNSRINDWRPVDVDELYVYFAVLLTTGACVKSSLKSYWIKNDMAATPGFGQAMSYNRFTLITSCLHFVDNATDLRTMPLTNAKIFKIKPVVDHLNDRFQALYKLGKNIAIDESLGQWKGWRALKKFINNKAAGAGIETFSLCESRTGYLWRFKVYSGRDLNEAGDNSLISGCTSHLVLELLEGLEDKGYTVWMNNYYNSPALARVLKSKGFDCVGTLPRLSRQNVPPQIKVLTKENMIIGEICGATSGDVDIVVWRDANRVAMVSTYHGAGVHRGLNKTRPIVVEDYRVCMGGVDKRNQMLSAFPIERISRGTAWYRQFFRRLMNTSVVNAFILHRRGAGQGTRPIRKHHIFRRVLVRQLLEKHRTNPASALRETSSGITDRVKLAPEVLRHFPEYYGFLPNETKNEKIRRSCVVCHKRQPYYCPTCDVPLCATKCIRVYHS